MTDIVTDPFISPCPPPTPYERELLEILIEECAEVQQRATKMLRFGVTDIQPGQEFTNRFRLGLEVGDLTWMIKLIQDAKLVNGMDILRGRDHKERQLAKYMQHRRDDAR